MTDDLTGLSKSACNATLYFDNKVFSARVAAAYRSDYFTTVPGRNSNDVEGTASTMNIDFSSSYNINDHFTVSLEALVRTGTAPYFDAIEWGQKKFCPHFSLSGILRA